DYVLSHLDQLVIKEAQGSGGYGMLIGPKASACEIDEFRKKLIATPHEYIAQPTLALSVAPTLTTSGVAERHIDLRPFVLSSP
ncbi:circularly permuted type 2 ATP-grasp protein, partial [Acinetobacter baumannii]